jgi:hypothetical protein
VWLGVNNRRKCGFEANPAQESGREAIKQGESIDGTAKDGIGAESVAATNTATTTARRSG